MTPRPFTPWPHNTEMIEHGYEHPRGALWAPMGAGKTVSCLTLLQQLDLLEPGRSLVLAPLRVARDTWPTEAAKWEHLSTLGVVPITGSEKERIAALKVDASIHTINYDVLPWLIQYLVDAKLTWRWSRVVADESTRLKSFRLGGYKKDGTPKGTAAGGERAKAIARVAHARVRRWINLTGTPSPNGLVDLWGQTWFLDEGHRLGRTIDAFRKRWFSYDQYTRVYSPQAHAQEQIHRALSDICITPTLPFAVDEPVVRPVFVELPRRARAHYDDMERRMFTEIAEHQLEAMTAAARTIKCLQLANGAGYIGEADDPGERQWVETHDEKLQALGSIVEEAAGMPVLVAYHFKSDRERILKAFPRAVDVATQSGMAQFRAGKAPIGVGHPKSMGHGIDGLQDVTNICAIFGHWWNLEEFDQFVARIGPVRQKQSGHNRPVFVYPIIARDTLDEDVMARRESKREVQDILLEAMKRRRA